MPRTKALTTLTVRKVFRRAEIERQQLRFEANLQAEFQLREIFTASESRKSRQAEHHAVMEIS